MRRRSLLVWLVVFVPLGVLLGLFDFLLKRDVADAVTIGVAFPFVAPLGTWIGLRFRTMRFFGGDQTDHPGPP